MFVQLKSYDDANEMIDSLRRNVAKRSMIF